MTNKFSVFISHVSEDEAIAVMLKNSIERVFLNSEVFVSGRDLKGGEIWVNEIREKLRKSSVIIALITEYSRDSNWVFFETGLGFVENKSIPFCVAPLTMSNLTPPLSLLQSRDYNEDGLKKLLQDIANITGLRIPQEIPGISEEVNELKKYLSLRNNNTKEEKTTSLHEKDIVRTKKSEEEIREDAEIKNKISQIELKVKKFLISQLLLVDSTYKIPPQKELQMMNLSDIDELGRYANIPFDSFIITRLGIEKWNIPAANAPQWKTINKIKGIESISKDVSKYIKD
jgi:hypothetical protein